MNVIDMKTLDLKGKRILIREDLNVPLGDDGAVASDARIRAALPTIEAVLAAGGKLMVMSHLGRPKEGLPLSEQMSSSMRPVVDHLQKLTGKKIRLVADYLDGLAFGDEGFGDEAFGDEDFIIFENVRINQGEKANDEQLAKQYAALCDIFVMDAFGTAHRAQASTEGVARYAPVACAGPLLMAELEALDKALANPKRPIVAIVGGSKVSTKLEVLNALSDKVDHLIVGGGIANTFLAAAGHEVGISLYEPTLVDMAKSLQTKVNIPIPVDVVTAKAFNKPETAESKAAKDVQADDMVLDIGPESCKQINEIIKQAATIIWNGPVGVFEQDAFAGGTESLTKAIAASQAFSIAGGGDTLAAIDKYQAADDISYISTGGGAFLEFVEGKVLPAVAILEARAKDPS